MASASIVPPGAIRLVLDSTADTLFSVHLVFFGDRRDTDANESCGTGGRHGRGRVHRLAPGRGPPGRGATASGSSTTSPPATARTSPTSSGALRVARGRPRRFRRLPAGRRGGRVRLPPGGDPERPAVGPRAAPVARQRADGHAQRARGRRGRPGVRRVMFAASQQRLRRDRGAAQARGDAPQPPEPLRRRQARRRALRPASTPGRWASTASACRYFNIFGPRQDPSSPYSGVISLFARAMAEGRRPRHLRRRPPDPRLHLRGQRRRRQPAPRCVRRRPLGGAVLNVGTGRRISLLDLVAAINARPRHRPRARVPARPGRRRPRLAGEPRPDPRPCSATSRSSTSRKVSRRTLATVHG